MRKMTDRDRELGKVVSENLRTLCDLKRGSQRRLAEKCGVHPSALTKWTDGRIVPSVLHMITISEYFGVTIDWLVTKHNFDGINVAQLLSKAVDSAKEGD